MPRNFKYKGILFTDLDGTIKPPKGQKICQDDLEALKELGTKAWFRVVATGRSLFSFVQAWGVKMELDALIFSSGNGLCLWNKMGPSTFLRNHIFTPQEADMGIKAALALGRGFYAYHAPPDSHHFYYQLAKNVPDAFHLRIESFAQQTKPWSSVNGTVKDSKSISQILIMVPNYEADEVEKQFKRLAPGLSVLRSTSPFNDGYLWLEIFPPGISKGDAANFLTEKLKLKPTDTIALGNDYNDIELLAWAGSSFVTQDAPQELSSLYPTIKNAGQGGLAQVAASVIKKT